MTNGDPWLQASAIDAIGAARWTPFAPRLEALLLDELPEIVRDAAHDALAALDAPEPGRRLRVDAQGRTMLNTVDKVLYLKGVELFSRLPAEDLVGVAAIAHPTFYSAGSIVFGEGDPGDALYLVVFGQVAVRAGDRALATLGPGECFGEMALLDALPRSATVTAASDLTALRIGRDDFEDLIAERPEVLRGVVRVLTARLRANNSA